MALARLHRCTGSPAPWLVTYLISTLFIWAGLNINSKTRIQYIGEMGEQSLSRTYRCRDQFGITINSSSTLSLLSNRLATLKQITAVSE